MSRFWVILSILFSVSLSARAADDSGSLGTILVRTQAEFDQMPQRLSEALKAGEKDIVIRISAGRYHYSEKHISLRDTYYKDVSLHWIGEKAEIVSAGSWIPAAAARRGAFSPDAAYLDQDLKDVFFWSDMYQTDRLVEVVDAKEKLCRLHCPGFEIPAGTDLGDAYLQLTEWYMSGTYKIRRAEGAYVYFTASDLSEGMAPYGNYNVNYDYTVVKKYPRFRVCNLPVPTCRVKMDDVLDGKSLFRCMSSCFLDIYGSDFKKIEISGISFVGSSHGGALLRMQGARTTEGISISDCRFSAIRSVAVYMLETSKVAISRCSFEDCYNNVLLAIGKGVKDITVVDNRFRRVGMGLGSTAAIRCQCTGFYVAGNEIVDFGMMGIGVGKGASEEGEGSGIVERNVLYFTDDYFAWAADNSLMDSGAIYLWTRNDGTVIRYNRIHQYTGAHSNRGIYCDDGAYGFSLYGNVITRVPNSNYIDSRRVPSAKLPTNTANEMRHNVIMGRYRFEGKPGDGSCENGPNVILLSPGATPPDNVLDQLGKSKADLLLPYDKVEGLRITVPARTRRSLERLPVYPHIEQYFR